MPRGLSLAFVLNAGVSSAALAQNLVVNGEFSQGNSGFGSDYAYSPALNNDEGQYTVRANGGCGWNGGFVCIPDHSASGDQLMFVGNGDLTQAQRVWFQTVSVTPGAMHRYEMWVATAVSGGPARLEVSINGTVLGTQICPPTPQDGFIAFSAPWTAGAGDSSAVITIINRNIAEFPNDFYMDDISFAPVPPPPCPGDANGDGTVDFTDVISVLANFGTSYAPGTGLGDANNDGVVDFADVISVLANFGDACA